MRKVHFDIDEATGKVDINIEGMVGKSCDPVQALLEDLLGQPARVEPHREYFATNTVTQQVRGG